MRHESMSATGRRVLVFAFVLGLVAFASAQTQAQTFRQIYYFTGGADGAFPLAGLVTDTVGNFYGTTSAGGSSGAGVVFKMTPSGTQQVLYSFTGGTDGANPQAGLLLDASSNLYGTTPYGGAYGAGTVFLVNKSKEKVLYSFTGGADGANPEASLIMDASGNLYGTTFAGGTYGAGTVFEVNKQDKETVLYSFAGGSDGANPGSSVIMNAKGRLFGTTSAGGTNGYGTVFQLTSSKAGWKETILHNFEMQSDGGNPFAGLVFDNTGNLYGAATSGGSGSGGTVFELTPSKSGWNFTVLSEITGWSISGTYGNLVLDASGNIYGATHCDGTYQSGTVYVLKRAGKNWTYTLLYTFTGANDGSYTFGNLAFDKQGNLYGTTVGGGGESRGTVFKVTP